MFAHPEDSASGALALRSSAAPTSGAPLVLILLSCLFRAVAV
jgi:hypothetical protein